MEADPSAEQITQLLREWRSGSREALDRLVPLVYAELHTLASRQLSREWRHTRQQTTALVSEAYLKLFGQSEVDWQNRGHFFAVAAQVMRRIVVDHARRELRGKRGGKSIHVELDEAGSLADGRVLDAVDALALDRALDELEALDAGQARVVELRFFGGLTVPETAAALGLSAATVKREWAVAKAWLFRALSASDQA
jgi:RNA polymerase sigma factor (TIGR02999 family)